MSDLFSRQAAIDALMEILDRPNHAEFLYTDEICKALGELPSAYRPTWEWEIEYNGNGWNDYWDYTCPNCGKKYERADAVLYKANFCPNCGSRLKGADDETN